MIVPLTVSVMAALMSPTAPMVCPMSQSTEQDVAKAVKAVEKITDDYRAEQQVFYKKVGEAETDEERTKIYQNDAPDRSARFLELKKIATAHPGSEAAANAASWVLSMQSQGGSPSDDGNWALDMMLNDFIDSEHIESVPMMCSGMTIRNIDALERIRKESGNDRARALADYIRAKQLIMLSQAAQELIEEGSSGSDMISYHMGQMDDELKTKLSASGMVDEYLKAGEALLAHCQETYAEIAMYKGSDRMIGILAERELFEMHNLQIGDLAPDIEGIDAEGVSFRLSDYRGQVVVIDFWGFW